MELYYKDFKDREFESQLESQLDNIKKILRLLKIEINIENKKLSFILHWVMFMLYG